MRVAGCVVGLEGVLVGSTFGYLVGGGDPGCGVTPGEVAPGQVAVADGAHRMRVAPAKMAPGGMAVTVDPGARREQFIHAVVDGRVVVDRPATRIPKELCIVALAESCRDNEL